MLIYNPTYDIYHGVFRILRILETLEIKPYRIEFIRIADFYFLFPHLFSDIRMPNKFRKLKSRTANLKNNYKWMSIALHELGHGIYFENFDSKLPFLLKECSSLTTEGISEMFGDLVRDPAWMEDILKVKLSNQEKREIEKISAAENLVFLRWVLVMFHFEKSLYENPDQDLNSLWWNLKEKYQLENRPENRNKPDYAAKIHLISSPVYYHDYLLGQFFGAQLKSYAIKNILSGDKEIQNNKEFGEYLREKVFKPGLLYGWNSLTEYATGEKLKVDYLIEQLVS